MASGGETVLAARDLVKEYREGESVQRVLDGVSLDVATGSFLSIMGPSGSGKSTLLHLLGGLDRPDRGEVLLRGEPLSALPDDARTRLRGSEIGIVYQFFNLIPVLTAEENVALPAVIAGRHEREYRARRDQVLELVGLSAHRTKQPSQLSGGQQQRVAIARALFIEPAVLLADEPTGNLDHASGAEILDLFVHAQRDLGQTIVMVTHDPRSAAIGDEVVLLGDGRIQRQLDLARAEAGDRTDRARAVLRWLESDEPDPAGGPDDVALAVANASADGSIDVDGETDVGADPDADADADADAEDEDDGDEAPAGPRPSRRRPLQAGPGR